MRTEIRKKAITASLMGVTRVSEGMKRTYALQEQQSIDTLKHLAAKEEGWFWLGGNAMRTPIFLLQSKSVDPTGDRLARTVRSMRAASEVSREHMGVLQAQESGQIVFTSKSTADELFDDIGRWFSGRRPASLEGRRVSVLHLQSARVVGARTARLFDLSQLSTEINTLKALPKQGGWFSFGSRLFMDMSRRLLWARKRQSGSKSILKGTVFVENGALVLQGREREEGAADKLRAWASQQAVVWPALREIEAAAFRITNA